MVWRRDSVSPGLGQVGDAIVSWNWPLKTQLQPYLSFGVIQVCLASEIQQVHHTPMSLLRLRASTECPFSCRVQLWSIYAFWRANWTRVSCKHVSARNSPLCCLFAQTSHRKSHTISILARYLWHCQYNCKRSYTVQQGIVVCANLHSYSHVSLIGFYLFFAEKLYYVVPKVIWFPSASGAH